jgi:hypothetical protein
MRNEGGYPLTSIYPQTHFRAFLALADLRQMVRVKLTYETLPQESQDSP